MPSGREELELKPMSSTCKMFISLHGSAHSATSWEAGLPASRSFEPKQGGGLLLSPQPMRTQLEKDELKVLGAGVESGLLHLSLEPSVSNVKQCWK